jgi:hypothetical protein
MADGAMSSSGWNSDVVQERGQVIGAEGPARPAAGDAPR